MFIVMIYKYLRYTLLAFTFPYGVQRHNLYAVHYTVMLQSKQTAQSLAASLVSRYSYFLTTYIDAGLEFVRGTLRVFNVFYFAVGIAYSYNSYIMCSQQLHIMLKTAIHLCISSSTTLQFVISLRKNEVRFSSSLFEFVFVH